MRIRNLRDLSPINQQAQVTQQPGLQQAQPDASQQGSMQGTLKKIKNGAPYLIGSLVLVFISYKGAEWLIKNTEIGWFWSSVLVFIVAALIIWAIDGAMGSQSSPARIPVKAFLTIAFIMSMVKGCESHPVIRDESRSIIETPARSEMVYAETLDLSVANFAATTRIFGPGDKPEILVVGNPVKLNQSIVAPGEYFVPVTGSGPLVFEQVNGKPATVYLH